MDMSPKRHLAAQVGADAPGHEPGPGMKQPPSVPVARSGLTRRHFLKAGATVAFTAASWNRVLGANERVHAALIGCGGRGMLVARLMREVPNVEFARVCDLYPAHLARAREWAGPAAREYKDFRRVLERKEIDAVLIATPDHWHAIPTVLACQAGKDVYVEKPLAHNVREGRAMVAAARRHNRIVQMGRQQRSAPHYAEVGRIWGTSHFALDERCVGTPPKRKSWTMQALRNCWAGRRANRGI